MNRFQGDIKVKITLDGAKMKFTDGEPVRDKGIENAISIALFTKPGWWGNTLIRETNKKIGSDFERQRVIVDVDTLNEVRDDANRALQPLLDTNLLSKFDLIATNPNLNYIEVKIKTYSPGQDIKELLFFTNGINWVNQAEDPAYRKMEDVI
jgi:phage gp46-like protein